jgi:hypothetical protein
MKVAVIRITEAILFKLGLLSSVNFNAREYNILRGVGLMDVKAEIRTD